MQFSTLLLDMLLTRDIHLLFWRQSRSTVPKYSQLSTINSHLSGTIFQLSIPPATLWVAMPIFADILPVAGRSIPILLTYAVPEALAEKVQPGAQVAMPLGNRNTAGYVVEIHGRIPNFPTIKSITSVLDGPPVFTPRELDLARWMAGYYCCPLALALRPFIADTGAVRVRRRLKLTPAGEERLDAAQSVEGNDLLIGLQAIRERKSSATAKTVAVAVGARRAPAVIRTLTQQGLIKEATSLVAVDESKPVEMVSLAVDHVTARAEIDRIIARAPRQAAILEFFLAEDDESSGEHHELTLAQLAEIAENPSAARALLKRGILKARAIESWRRPWAGAPVDYPPPPELNQQQHIAAEQIIDAVVSHRHETFLLFGVTGSGKTEIFLQAAREALEHGRQALLLAPEIALSAQVVGLLRDRFGENVAILHSGLSAGERRDEKERVRLGRANVVVGPRSALFAPFSNLGIVVVDEEHDASYKQEQDPRYHARDVAMKLAEQYKCPCILASATPALESYYLAQKGDYRLLRLDERPDGRPLPEVRLLDLRGKSKRPKILLPPLLQGLRDCLHDKGQAIIFLNRRGHSTFLFCPVCGHDFRCPHCQVGLIYHIQDRILRCHHCDYTLSAPTLCPNCEGSTLYFAGFGTQRIVQELERLYPNARIARMDRDTTSRRGSHLKYVSEFRDASTDILVGTQMVSKGFDFPGVTIVGVVAADVSLNMPDFRAAERTFQLLTQVAGRAGRGSEPGTVFIQTYHPEHYAITAASKHDFDTFYAQELAHRRDAGYPPFSHLANIICTSALAEVAYTQCEMLANEIRTKVEADELDVLGPAPAPLAKLKDQYRFHVLLRAYAPGVIQRILGSMQDKLAPHGKIHIDVDIDPVSLM